MTYVPLSHAYTSTPWPIAAFNVMSKPGGAGCNLACEYCFYRHNQKTEGGRGKKEEKTIRDSGFGIQDDEERGCGGAMEEGLLERFVAEYIAAQDNYTVFFTWQGGEPTLVGLEFYKKVVELQKRHARPGVVIANALQTNGVLLDETWCRFLAEQRWAVGISIDGPEAIHDSFRRFRGGSPTHAQVLRAVRLLQQHRVRFDTLATVTPLSVGKAAELYDYFTEELGCKHLQFQPCVERKDYQTVAPGHWPEETTLPIGDPRLRPGHPESILMDYSITAEGWGSFLCQLFDRWWEKGRKRGVVINWFDSWASQFAGGPALMCICSPICGRSVSMEREGSLYSCDHFVYPEYRLGGFGTEAGLSDLVRTQRQRQFGEGKSRSLPGHCQRCPFLFACYGECPKRRFTRTPEGEPGLNYLCPAFRSFFHHAGPRLAEHGRARGVRGGTRLQPDPVTTDRRRTP